MSNQGDFPPTPPNYWLWPSGQRLLTWLIQLQILASRPRVQPTHNTKLLIPDALLQIRPIQLVQLQIIAVWLERRLIILWPGLFHPINPLHTQWQLTLTVQSDSTSSSTWSRRYSWGLQCQPPGLVSYRRWRSRLGTPSKHRGFLKSSTCTYRPSVGCLAALRKLFCLNLNGGYMRKISKKKKKKKIKIYCRVDKTLSFSFPLHFLSNWQVKIYSISYRKLLDDFSKFSLVHWRTTCHLGVKRSNHQNGTWIWFQSASLSILAPQTCFLLAFILARRLTAGQLGSEENPYAWLITDLIQIEMVFQEAYFFLLAAEANRAAWMVWLSRTEIPHKSCNWAYQNFVSVTIKKVRENWDSEFKNYLGLRSCGSSPWTLIQTKRHMTSNFLSVWIGLRGHVVQ